MQESQVTMAKQASAAKGLSNDLAALQQEYADYKAKATRILQVNNNNQKTTTIRASSVFMSAPFPCVRVCALFFRRLHFLFIFILFSPFFPFFVDF